MATATKSKTTAAAPAVPVTFAEINARKMRERIEAYRVIVTKQATATGMTVEDMEQAAELLDQLGLPQFTFDRDVAAMQRFMSAREKFRAAVEAQPESAQRVDELRAEVEATTKKLAMLREQLQLANAKANKSGAYGQTLAMLQHDHPHVLADLDVAVQLRIEELNKRKHIGGAA